MVGGFLRRKAIAISTDTIPTESGLVQEARQTPASWQRISGSARRSAIKSDAKEPQNLGPGNMRPNWRAVMMRGSPAAWAEQQRGT